MGAIKNSLAAVAAAAAVTVGLVATSTPASAVALDDCGTPANVVVNCGFETGDSSSWTLTGNVAATGVQAEGRASGYSFAFGSEGSDAFLSQVITGTSPDTTYDFSFWLRNYLPCGDHFAVTVSGIAGGSETFAEMSNAAAFDWTQFTYQFTTASSGSPTVTFAGRNACFFYYLDDVSVVSASPVLTPQAITFTSVPPDDAVPGDSYTVTATGGGSGNPVVFAADASSVGCTVAADGSVSFTAVGVCVIDADQAGDDSYEPAPQVQQNVTVRNAQTVTFTSSVPMNAVPGGSYSATASASGGGPVVFSAASVSASVCTVAGDGSVSFDAAGLCRINADQAGDADYAPARARQVMRVRTAQAISITSTPPAHAIVGDNYMVTASGGGSGNPVVFSAASVSASVCTVASDGAVSVTGVGRCVINATQAGNTSYAPALRVQQRFRTYRA